MEMNKLKIILDYEILFSLDTKEFYDEIEKMFFSESDKKNIQTFFFDKKSSDSLNFEDYITIGCMEDLSYYSCWQNDDEFCKLSEKLSSAEFKLGYWRRIKGDGNCYYRAVLIQYLEIIISSCIADYNVDLIINLIRDLCFIDFEQTKENFRNKTITLLCYIINQIQLKNYENAANFLYLIYNKTDIFEKCLILWLRLKLISFLRSHLTFEINGMKLLNLLPGFEYEDDNSYDKTKIDNYIASELLKMDEYVEIYPLYITPIVFKIGISVYHV